LAARNRLDAAIAVRVGSFDVRELCGSGRAALHPDVVDGVSVGCRRARRRAGCRGRGCCGPAGLAAAAADGTVSSEHVDKVQPLVHRVGIEAVRDYDEILATVSAAAAPIETQRAAERIAAHLDPDGKPPDPEADFDRRELTLARVGSMTYVRAGSIRRRRR
jgi:hypothetical protein